MDDLVAHLQAHIARLTRERDEAVAQERALWRAFAMAKAAAERLEGAGSVLRACADGNVESGVTDDYQAVAEAAMADIAKSERLAGCAIES